MLDGIGINFNPPQSVVPGQVVTGTGTLPTKAQVQGLISRLVATGIRTIRNRGGLGPVDVRRPQ